MEKLNKYWKGEAEIIRRMNPADLRTNPTIHGNVTAHHELFENARDELKKHYPDISGMTVLEIGPGNGAVCNLLLAEDVSFYTVIDHEPMLRLFEYAVGELEIGRRVRMVNVEEIESATFEESYDLFVSTNCLSEVPEDYLSYVVDNLISRCKRVFVLDGPPPFPGVLVEQLEQWFNIEAYKCPWNQIYDAYIITGDHV